MPSPPLLRLESLRVGYDHGKRGRVTVAERIDQSIESAQFVCLVGPNGAGKSTLLRTICGMQRPLGGAVLLDGLDLHEQPAAELARRVSVVLTDHTGAGGLTARGLVALGRHPYTSWTGRLTPEDERVIGWALECTSATELGPRQVDELSDGERQRVLVARALAQEPDLMVLDEPTAFLDLPHRVELMSLLRGLARSTSRTFLLSTHDLDLALRTADLIWLLGPSGSLVSGAPEDLVLDGAFAEAFSNHSVRFDSETGAFRFGEVHGGLATVEGSGPALVWTVRALNREGYEVVPAGHHAETSIVVREGPPRTWQLTQRGETIEAASIADLVSRLEPPQG
jgi:iron complex transport system ATP-binding protein